MTRKSRKQYVTQVQGSAGLAERANELRSKGFIPVTTDMPNTISGDQPSGVDLHNYISAQLVDNSDGNRMNRNIPLLFASGGDEIPTPKDKGTPELGFISWGAGNRVPNIISLLTNLIPFTAAGWKFNTDLASGMGPVPMYHYVEVSNGQLMERDIPYESAGELLKDRIKRLEAEKRQLKVEKEQQEKQEKDEEQQQQNRENEQQSEQRRQMLAAQLQQERSYAFHHIGSSWTPPVLGTSDSLSAANAMAPMPKITIEPDDDDEKEDEDGKDGEEEKSMIDQQLDEAREDLKIWEQTNEEVKDFMDRNNLNLVFTQLFGDQIMLGMCFPEIQLQQTYIDEDTQKPVKGSNWRPKAVGLGYRMAHVSRLERKDNDGKINYVYISNQWLDRPNVEQGVTTSLQVDVIPALDIYNPTGDLKQRLIDARNNKLGKTARPTRFILPTFYPTVGRPYYPVPAWWSIYGGDIYEYAATLVHDRLQQKKNSNVIGRIIYIYQPYLESMYMEGGYDTPQRKKEFRDKFYAQVNNFLSGRANKGKSLLGFTMLDPEGREHKTFEVVEIADASKSTADANKTELAEISSIIFFAMGLDAKLIGNEPGSTSGSSGTDLRTRYLLKQIQMTPTQQLVLKPMEVIDRINEWDRHLNWQIRREVMTTLDNSKTGVTAAKDNSQQ